MPSTEKKQQSELISVIDSFLDEKSAGKDDVSVGFLSIIDFIDRFKLLPNGLFPAQKFVLKLYYSIPLDDTEKVIKITDRFNTRILHELTEVEYLKFLYDQGRCNIRVQDDYVRHELILVLGRRSGKCGDIKTRILTSSGLVSLNDLLGSHGVDRSQPGWHDLGIDVVQQGGKTARADSIYYGGIQQIMRVHTHCGYHNGVTPEHRLRVMHLSGAIGWKYVRDLQVGDYVGIARSCRVWPNQMMDISALLPRYSVSSNRSYKSRIKNNIRVRPRASWGSYFDESLAEFVGILVGDGTWTCGKNRGQIQVTGGCENFREYVEKLFIKFIGRFGLKRVKKERTTCEVGPWQIRVGSVKDREFLDKLGYRLDATKSTKSVPWPVFKSPKSVVAAFLRGLFETDGGMEKGNMITFSSHSRQLCDDVQELLLNFGIVCRVSSKYSKRFQSVNYRLSVLGGRSRHIFSQEIGFITQRKNKILRKSLAKANSGCSNTESIPFLKQKLRDLRDSVPKSKNNIPGTLWSSRPRSDLKELMGGCAKLGVKEDISCTRLQCVVDFARKNGANKTLCDDLQSIIDADYFWDPVTSIAKDEAEVADLSVPGYESYVAGGVSSHNSTLAAIIASYELYKLLRRRNPQGHYGLPVNSEIRVLCVANDKEQASIVYGDMSGYVDNVDYFKSSMTHQTQTFMRFQTDQDRQRYGKGGRSTVTATFKSSIAKGLRGRGIICYILDEIAFFVDDGKCLNVDSLISTDEGLLTLDAILDRAGVNRTLTGWTDIDLGIVQESGRVSRASRVYYGGTQSVRVLTTKSGYRIGPTPEHGLKVMSASGDIVWKYVRDIEPGDFVGINRSSKLWPINEYDCTSLIDATRVEFRGRHSKHLFLPRYVDTRFGEFLGILTGDRTWRAGKDKSLVQVTGGCEQFLPFIRRHFVEWLGDYHVTRKEPHVNNTCEVSPWHIAKRSVEFRHFLDKLGYRLNVTKATKAVPWVIFRSPKHVVAAFLRGLFETDGGTEQLGRTISFSTASSHLAEQVQLLLLNFGITASVYTKYNKKYRRNYYIVRIIGAESRKVFAEEIRFITDRKNRDLDGGSIVGRDASNIIPNQYARLRRILESVSKARVLKKGNDARTRMTRLCSSSADSTRRSSISYVSARRLVNLGYELGADVRALDELRHLCDTNYFWDPVTSVCEEQMQVADLFVPDGHEYVAQGMASHNSSAEQVYRAVNPSIAQFSPKDIKNKHRPVGPSDGRAIMISSPDARDGFLYRQYQMSLSGGIAGRNMLMIQAPTWEVNPTLDKSYYEVEFNKDPKSFMTEHGAEFSDRVRGWIEDQNDLLECVKPSLKPMIRGMARELFWAGVDFGIVRDGTAISLIHFVDGKIELAYHEVWYAGKNWHESNPHLTTPVTDYARTLGNVSRLDVSEIAEWFRILSTRFYIERGVFDQWAGPIFEQELHKRGLKQFEMRNFSVSDSSHAFHTTKMCMFGRQLSVYDYPTPQQLTTDSTVLKHSPLISEMLELQATSGGKNITVVESPKVAGKHDDMSDSLVRGVLLAAEYIKSHPGILETSIRHIMSPLQQAPMPSSYRRYHSMRQRMHGGPDKLRTAPPVRR